MTELRNKLALDIQKLKEKELKLKEKEQALKEEKLKFEEEEMKLNLQRSINGS